MKKLRLTVVWDEAYWLVSDQVWAYATGSTLRSALRNYVQQVEDFVDECGDGSDLGPPALHQYQAYKAFLEQQPRRRWKWTDST
jgi:hypothetical protein